MNIKQITHFVTNLLLFICTTATPIMAFGDSDTTTIQTNSDETSELIDSSRASSSSTEINSNIDSVKKNSVLLPVPDKSDDSVQRIEKENSFQEELLKRRSIFDRKKDDSLEQFSPFYISNNAVYQSDMSSPSELLSTEPFITSAQFGLSSSLNRLLYFGNTAPITDIHNGFLLGNTRTHPFEGTDQNFLTETAAIQLHPGYLTYQNPSYTLFTPEVLLYWENGVFNENILNIRFSRPFTKTLTGHIYSNYRYFNGKSYNHLSNDIFSFFNTFQDSADISLRGYSPLINEHLTGAGFLWSGNNQKTAVSIKYGEFNNEIAIDRPGKIDESAQAMYSRFPLALNVSTSIKLPKTFFTDLELQYHLEPVIRITGDSVQNSNRIQQIRKDAKETRIDGALRVGMVLSQNDSIGILQKLYTHKRIAFDESEVEIVQYQPTLFYNKQIQLNNSSAKFILDAGSRVSSFKDSLAITLQWHAATDLIINNKRIRLFLHQDILPFISNLDSITTNTFLIDNYFRAGCDFNLNFDLFNLLLGYQFTSGIDTQSVINAWPSKTPPYQQPKSSFVVAPSLGLGKRILFKAHTIISDVRPYLKAYGSIDYTIHPISTSEFIDIGFYTEFWSKRDKIVFADRDDWNKPVLHSGLKITAHIRSFRLFYKVDNILNRQFAYVPGYYSPGITFRWGFNWFIQR